MIEKHPNDGIDALIADGTLVILDVPSEFEVDALTASRGTNGATFCLFATEECGPYKAHRCTEDEYKRWKDAGKITWQGDIAPPAPGYEAKPTFMCLVRVEDNFDFVSGGPR